MVRQNNSDNVPPTIARGAYERLLQRAHALAEKALLSLEGLGDLYPSDLPPEVVEAVRRFHAHPPETALPGGHEERRRTPRLPARDRKLVVAAAESASEGWEVPAVDRSWDSVAFLTHRPLGVGSVVLIWDAAELRTLPPIRGEVKSCRPVEDAWVVGCELRAGGDK
jgi:hypothetical protein